MLTKAYVYEKITVSQPKNLSEDGDTVLHFCKSIISLNRR